MVLVMVLLIAGLSVVESGVDVAVSEMEVFEAVGSTVFVAVLGVLLVPSVFVFVGVLDTVAAESEVFGDLRVGVALGDGLGGEVVAVSLVADVADVADVAVVVAGVAAVAEEVEEENFNF